MEGGTKVYMNGQGHMTKMAATPIYGKTFKNILLQNRKSYDLETWQAALGTQALQVHKNDDLALTLTFSTAMTMTLHTNIPSLTQLVVCIYQLLGHRLQ